MRDVPTIVLGRVVTALGVIRALAHQRIPFFWVTEDPDFVAASRWCRRFPSTVGSPSGPADLAGFLERVPVDRAVLIPCSDHWNKAAAALDPALSARFLTSIPDASTLAKLTDKSTLATTLRDLGIPHPRSIPLREEADLAAAPPEEVRNWFIKPCDSQAFQKHFNCKAFRVASPDDARKRYRTIREAGFEAVFQEYIPGPASQHFFIDGFVDAQGDLKALFARQRIRMFPADFGDSTYVTSVSPAVVADAVTSVQSLLRAVPYRGIFSIEFKHDQRDGRFKLIEVNTRPWAFVQFAVECGVDVVHMAYQDALGEPVPTVKDYPIGRSTAYSPQDWVVGWRQVRNGELSLFALVQSELRATSLVFRWDDPLPHFFRIWPLVCDWLRKRGWSRRPASGV